MLSTEFPEINTKEYHERELAKHRLLVDTMAAGIADIFAKRDRYTQSELGDIAKLFYDAVDELEITQKTYDDKFESEDDEE